MHHWNLKHIQMCAEHNHKPTWDPGHCFSTCSCLIFTSLPMEIFQQTCNFSVQNTHIKLIYFIPLQLHSVKGQTVLVRFCLGGWIRGWQLYERGSVSRQGKVGWERDTASFTSCAAYVFVFVHLWAYCVNVCEADCWYVCVYWLKETGHGCVHSEVRVAGVQA